MPVYFDLQDETPIAFEELVEYIDSGTIDFSKEESLLHAAQLLRRLSNNRTFLADLICRVLQGDRKFFGLSDSYASQVFMLHSPRVPRGRNYAIRACVWPSEREQLMRVSGTKPFVYHLPHDHNFSFLTVGYHGPGYVSNYYTSDRRALAGVPGEPANLHFVEQRQLSLGQVMQYRAYVDVHDQLPPESLSVSLNIVESSPESHLIDQLIFDTATDTVSKAEGVKGNKALFDAAVLCGGAEHRGMVEEIAVSHASPSARLRAVQALAMAAANSTHEIGTLERYTSASSPQLVRQWAVRRVTQLASN
jgi:hypothetical protein